MLTWGDLAGAICAVIGIVVLALGGFSTFAGAVAATESDKAIRIGCAAMIIGLIMVTVGAWRLMV